MTGPAHLKDPELRPTWENRRKVIFGTLIFCSLVEIALIVGWYLGVESSPMVVTIAGGNRLTAVAVVGSYVFNATWEDIRLWKP